MSLWHRVVQEVVKYVGAYDLTNYLSAFAIESHQLFQEAEQRRHFGWKGLCALRVELS